METIERTAEGNHEDGVVYPQAVKDLAEGLRRAGHFDDAISLLQDCDRRGGNVVLAEVEALPAAEVQALTVPYCPGQYTLFT